MVAQQWPQSFVLPKLRIEYIVIEVPAMETPWRRQGWCEMAELEMELDVQPNRPSEARQHETTKVVLELLLDELKADGKEYTSDNEKKDEGDKEVTNDWNAKKGDMEANKKREMQAQYYRKLKEGAFLRRCSRIVLCCLAMVACLLLEVLDISFIDAVKIVPKRHKPVNDLTDEEWHGPTADKSEWIGPHELAEDDEAEKKMRWHGTTPVEREWIGPHKLAEKEDAKDHGEKLKPCINEDEDIPVKREFTEKGLLSEQQFVAEQAAFERKITEEVAIEGTEEEAAAEGDEGSSEAEDLSIETFHRIDQDGNGFIDVADALRFSAEENEGATEHWFRMADVDEDGQINIEEFVIADSEWRG